MVKILMIKDGLYMNAYVGVGIMTTENKDNARDVEKMIPSALAHAIQLIENEGYNPTIVEA